MKREVLQYADKNEWLKLRSQDITSTEVSALFNLSPYTTEFELWHRHKDDVIVEIDETDRMKWGSRLESAIAQGISEDQGWTVRPFKEYVRLPEKRMGSSFDYRVIDPSRVLDSEPDMVSIDSANEHLDSILEIKNVDALAFRDGWIVDGDNLEAPPHIEIQVQHQLAVSGLKRAYIGALIGGNQVVLIPRERDDEIIAAIEQKVEAFWKSIAANQPPKPDYERDAEFITKLYSYAEPGKVVTADDRIADLIDEYRKWSDAAKEAEDKKQGVKAQLLECIGDAEKCKGDLFTISAGMVGECEVAYTRKAYRNFRVSFKKERSK